jgi:hypothetical protein
VPDDQETVMNKKIPSLATATGEFKRVIRFMQAAASRAHGKTKLLIRPQGWFSNISMAVGYDDKQRPIVRLTGAGLDARITHGGSLVGCSKPDPIARTLRLLMESPEDMAREFGMLTGMCCLCSRKLTDPRSVTVGYGSTCAKQYGMRWGQVGQADLARDQEDPGKSSRRKKR